MTDKNNLTPPQKAFCDEFLKSLNATQAYKKAYPNCKTDQVASQSGSRLLRNEKVKAYIDKRQKEKEKKAIITQEMILKNLKEIVESKEECTSNRLKAMELAGKHLGMFKETNMNVNMNYEDYISKVVDDDEY